MHPIPRIATILAGLLITAGCSTGSDMPLEQARIGNIGVVDALDGDFTVAVDGQGRIPQTDRAAALQTLGSFGSPATTRARVTGATGTEARTALVRLLADAGIPPSHVGFADDAATPGQARVLLQRFTVTPPTCGGWPDIQRNYVENGPLLPLGCVTNRNLQVMIEDPRDLVVGRSLGDGDVTHDMAAITRYQTDKVKPFISTTATGGHGATISKQ